MKKYIVALATLPLLTFAQIKFTIKGKVGNYNAPAKAYLVYKSEGKDNIEEIILKNGKFEYKGTVKEPDMALFAIDKEGKKNIQGPNADAKVLCLEAGVININSKDEVKKASVVGGKLNQDFEEFKTKIDTPQSKMNAFIAEYQQNQAQIQQDAAMQKSYQERYGAIMSEIRGVEYEFILKHLSSHLSLKLLEGWMQAEGQYDVKATKLLLDNLSPEIKKTSKWIGMYKKLSEGDGTNVGDVALDIEQNDVNGHPVKLSFLKERYVLLDFWASWCGPCRAENPNVVAAFQKYKDKGFTVFGVSLDNSKANWLQAIEADNLTWVHVSDLRGWQNEAAQRYKVQGIPQNYLLGPDGTIIAKNLRGEALHNKLKEIFGE